MSAGAATASADAADDPQMTQIPQMLIPNKITMSNLRTPICAICLICGPPICVICAICGLSADPLVLCFTNVVESFSMTPAVLIPRATALLAGVLLGASLLACGTDPPGSLERADQTPAGWITHAGNPQHTGLSSVA